MKALVCLAAAVCIGLSIPPSASGQVTVGFQGGLSLAKISGDGVADDLSNRTGISIGAFLETPISGMLSFQPEVNYAQKGAKDSDEGFEVSLKIDYIEVPLLVKFDLPTSGSISPHVLVGPALGFKAGCKIGGEQGGTDVDVDCSEDDIDLKSFDFGAIVGAGVGFPAGPGEARIGARYNFGLLDVENSSEGEGVTNRAFSLLVGFSFPMGG